MGLTTARASVFEALREQPDPVSIEALGVALGRHHNTLREHLAWLVEAGLVSRIKQPSDGRGRPAWLYQARGARPTDDDYVELAAALAWSIQEATEDSRQEALAAGRHWGEAMMAEREVTPAPRPKAGRERTVTFLGDLGYAPTVDARADRVALHRCPLLQAAHRFPEVVCTVHLGLVQAVLAANGADPERADLVPFAAPGECHLRLMAPVSA